MSVSAFPKPLCGIFIGGESRRMGGSPKGLLHAPRSQQSLVARLVEAGQGLGLSCVLVGQRAEYAPLGLPMLEDRPAGIGPIGGLSALLAQLPAQTGGALALSCDLPYLSRAFLRRLLEFPTADCDVVAPRRDGRFEPLCARYLPSVQPILQQSIERREHALQRLLGQLRVAVLPISDDEARELDDWDSPSDVHS